MSRSMVVAVVALFFSLTGWGVAAKVALAPANSVGTQQIVNGSIRLTDIAPSTATFLQGQRGAVGPAGFPGLPGRQGIQGLPGLPGAQGLPGKSVNTLGLADDLRKLCQSIGSLRDDIRRAFPSAYLSYAGYTSCIYSY
jgi:hypothetical protein